MHDVRYLLSLGLHVCMFALAIPPFNPAATICIFESESNVLCTPLPAQ
jgi:hypothetical protein